MTRRWFLFVGLSAALTACRAGGSEPIEAVRLEVFAGEWRSVTPSLEFLRLTLQPKSSERDALAARLTFSGVYWEGSGRVDGDSLVLQMSVLGQGDDMRTLVARIGHDGTLRADVRPGTADAFSVDFVREN